MLEILGFMLCVYLIFKGVEIYQIGIASRPERKTEVSIIGNIMLVAGVIVAVVFVIWILNQAQSIPSHSLP